MHKRESYIVLLTIGLWALISTVNSNFALPSYLLELFGFNSVYFICGLGILPLMIKGDFDLSVGGIITSVSMMLAVFSLSFPMPYYILIILGAVIGMAFGLFNGYMIGKFRVPSVVVTLAMMNIHYGFAGYIYRKSHLSSKMTEAYTIGDYGLLGMSIENLLILLMVAMTYYLLHYSALGRRAYAFGGNHSLAKRKGYNHHKTTLKLHGFSGMAAGLSAAIYLMTFNQASVDAYSGIAFELIIIVVIGGLNILGGYGSVLGTVFAAVFIVMLKSGMVFARIPVFWHDMLIGLIIILIISYDMYKGRIRLYRLAKKGKG